MSKAEEKVIDSMIEVTILGIRKSSLSESLVRVREKTERKSGERSRVMSDALDAALNQLFGITPIVTLNKTDYK